MNPGIAPESGFDPEELFYRNTMERVLKPEAGFQGHQRHGCREERKCASVFCLECRVDDDALNAPDLRRDFDGRTFFEQVQLLA